MRDKCVLHDKHDICVLKSIAKPIKRTVASESNKKPRNSTRKIYEHFSKTCSWWYPKSTQSRYIWKPKSRTENVNSNVRTVKFENDQIAPILGYGDLVQGAITIKRDYYVKGLNHNLFSVGQFCDADLEVAFRKSTCFIRDLKGNDLLSGSRGTDLYLITLQDTNSPNLICLVAKATSSQAWLWHRRLSHLNFDTINLLLKNDIVVGLPKLKFIKDHLCSSYELGKAKRKSFHTKLTPRSKRQLQLLHMDLCGPVRVASINGKRYACPKRTSSLSWSGILHETTVARTPEQNGVVERQNRTLVEAARTMLSAAKVPLFFWAEAIATACCTQSRSLVIPRHEKTPYHIINDQKPDGENLDKMKEKGDECIFVGYSTHSRAYRVFNKRTQVIMESIHVNFDELPLMASNQNNSDPAPEFQPLATTVISSENINQAETYANNNQVADDEFINIFSTPVQDQGETSLHHVDSSNMHTFYQRFPSEHCWTKDYPLEQVIGNPSQPVRTRRQLESNAEMCMFVLT
nr:hypothetical protein [Tanacetum cinerariifolium]